MLSVLSVEKRMAGCVVAIDVGGTFTDIALADLDTGQLWTTKTPRRRMTSHRGLPLVWQRYSSKPIKRLGMWWRYCMGQRSQQI